MIFQVLLVNSLYLSAVLTIPIYDLPLSEENKPTEALQILSEKENVLELNAITTKSSSSATEMKESNDLIAQETFYPAGGIWWGVRPWGGWGGWGGYRPWHGWHGWHGLHGWNRPHWGGNWGGHWGGGSWGRTS